jgi:hypothetical protein
VLGSLVRQRQTRDLTDEGLEIVHSYFSQWTQLESISSLPSPKVPVGKAAQRVEKSITDLLQGVKVPVDAMTAGDQVVRSSTSTAGIGDQLQAGSAQAHRPRGQLQTAALGTDSHPQIDWTTVE